MFSLLIAGTIALGAVALIAIAVVLSGRMGDRINEVRCIGLDDDYFYCSCPDCVRTIGKGYRKHG